MTEEWVVYSEAYGDHAAYGPFTSYEAALSWCAKEYTGVPVPLRRP